MKLLRLLLLIGLCLPFFIEGEVDNSRHRSFQNLLNYSGDISVPKDRQSLAFSDQGAWFAYGFPSSDKNYGGFSGPFLMTQENGVWCSRVLSQLKLWDVQSNKEIIWENFKLISTSYNSHLEMVYKSDDLIIMQRLFFSSAHTAFIFTDIKNVSKRDIQLQAVWQGNLLSDSLQLQKQQRGVLIHSTKSKANGLIQVFGNSVTELTKSNKSYEIRLKKFKLEPGNYKRLILTQTFIFQEYDIKKEQAEIARMAVNPEDYLNKRILKKENQLLSVNRRLKKRWSTTQYRQLASKAILTLQNNWRTAAGELIHSGVFPSYHYKWFHGFWAWDSWKHAVALAQFNIGLARDQVRAMYDYMDERGFIPDCIYRDTEIEKHNYRNTKPPLSVWAVWHIYLRERDREFLKELYEKMIRQHYWWYKYRDHDKDGLCEYGSTDGTLKAAKWDSGMDNAVRFDHSKILKNSNGAFSLNQESVDLNSYLYSEKIFLSKIADILKEESDADKFKIEAASLKLKIQKQFFDEETGWFYDTDLEGKEFIKVMGCEGWIPLWAEVATNEQALAVKNNMMNKEKFNFRVPFQTLSADHPKFKPERGYWRGPVWIDQAYFGVKGLQNYHFNDEADKAIHKLIHNAEGVLEKGKSIRENYNPVTGKGMEARNFSWSAAHYLLLLMKGI